MRRQVDYHLAHARAAASGATPGARCVGRATSADGLARTLLRLHAERGVAIDVDVAAGACRARPARRPRRDARQPARQRLQVGASRGARDLGGTRRRPRRDHGGRRWAGLAPSMREAVLKRGVRADEAAPGSGLGLAIVRDLAELYGGTVTLDESSMGGVRAWLTLPGA